MPRQNHLSPYILPPPTHFKASDKDIDAFIQSKASILEYIPDEETIDDWSSIITIILHLDKKLNAESYIESILEGMKAESKKSEIILAAVHSYKDYSYAEVAFEYTTKDSSTEMMYMVYFSGPYDSAGLQYTVKLDHWLNHKQAEAQANKMRAFAEKYLIVSE